MNQKIIKLIQKLRNKSDPEKNFKEFRKLVEADIQSLMKKTDSRWLVSICDTYADYGTPIERRNALIISTFITMLRIGETYSLLLSPFIHPDKLKVQALHTQYLYDGLRSLAIDKQDTLVNLSKRILKAMEDTPAIEAIYRELILRVMTAKSLLNKLAHLSTIPEKYMPLDALEMPDNHGVT